MSLNLRISRQQLRSKPACKACYSPSPPIVGLSHTRQTDRGGGKGGRGFANLSLWPFLACDTAASASCSAFLATRTDFSRSAAYLFMPPKCSATHGPGTDQISTHQTSILRSKTNRAHHASRIASSSHPRLPLRLASAVRSCSVRSICSSSASRFLSALELCVYVMHPCVRPDTQDAHRHDPMLWSMTGKNYERSGGSQASTHATRLCQARKGATDLATRFRTRDRMRSSSGCSERSVTCCTATKRAQQRPAKRFGTAVRMHGKFNHRIQMEQLTIGMRRGDWLGCVRGGVGWGGGFRAPGRLQAASCDTRADHEPPVSLRAR